jgi:hypothetical protein
VSASQGGLSSPMLVTVGVAFMGFMVCRLALECIVCSLKSDLRDTRTLHADSLDRVSALIEVLITLNLLELR